MIDIGLLGRIPDNFTVVPSAPQIELHPNVEVFVSHGGLNSTMESLCFGVPRVIIPSIREQSLTARRVQKKGLGVVLDHAKLIPDDSRRSTRCGAYGRPGPDIRTRIGDMQRLTQGSGGARQATEAEINFTGQM
jgi:hypothetical protein